MRYGPEHKKETRARVLRQAARAIRAEGPHRIGIAEVMARAGLTHGGFYAHFASKDDLVAAAIAQMFEEALALLEGVTAAQPPKEALRAYIDLYLSPKHRDAKEAGCPMAVLSADLPRLTGLARRRFAAGFGTLATAFSGLISASGRPESEALARSVLAEMVGALTLARGTAGSKQSNAILQTSRRSVASRLGLLEENQHA